MKRLFVIGLIITAASVLYIKSQSIAADPPHSSAQAIYCNSCHSVHNASGTSLTSEASNANLCLSCHTSGGVANNKRLNTAMQAIPKVSGTSHRWDAAMPLIDSPNNQYGLRWATSLTTLIKPKLNTFGSIIPCSVCHNQHSQANTPWDAFAPGWTTVGTGSGRNFQRISNDMNQICEDCHYYRAPATSGTDVRTWDGNKKSHPVKKIFTNDIGRNVWDTTQFNNVPLEPASANWAWQSGGRYHLNGGSDNNVTNNIVVDSSKQIRCLSCHGIHYSDSSSGTIDGP